MGRPPTWVASRDVGSTLGRLRTLENLVHCGMSLCSVPKLIFRCHDLTFLGKKVVQNSLKFAPKFAQAEFQYFGYHRMQLVFLSILMQNKVFFCGSLYEFEYKLLKI